MDEFTIIGRSRCHHGNDRFSCQSCKDAQMKSIHKIFSEAKNLNDKSELDTLREKNERLNEEVTRLYGLAYSNGELYNKEYLRAEAAEARVKELEAKLARYEQGKQVVGEIDEDFYLHVDLWKHGADLRKNQRVTVIVLPEEDV